MHYLISADARGKIIKDDRDENPSPFNASFTMTDSRINDNAISPGIHRTLSCAVIRFILQYTTRQCMRTHFHRVHDTFFHRSYAMNASNITRFFSNGTPMASPSP